MLVYVGGVCFFMRSCCVSNTLQLVIPFMLCSSFGSMKIHLKMYAQTQLQKWHHIIHEQGSSKRQFQFLFRQTMHVAHCTLVPRNGSPKDVTFWKQEGAWRNSVCLWLWRYWCLLLKMYMQGKKIILILNFVCLGKATECGSIYSTSFVEGR